MIDISDRTIGVFAGLSGATGVATMAAATHAFPGTHVDTAGLMLVLHAAALIGLANPAAGCERIRRIAALMMIVGVSLFSGDLVFKAMEGARLFPYAAPIGGMLLIGAWIVAAVAFAVRR